MSQSVGQVFKSRIPTLGDDASIQEALRVYHYGVDNYSTQSIPDDSIEGNFRSLNARVTAAESIVSGALTQYVSRISQSSSPNVVTAQSTTTVPISVRAIASQTSALQQWQNSSSSTVASISTAGYVSTSNYISVGSLTENASIAVNVNIVNPSNRGIMIRGASGQTANLQEWQNASQTKLAAIFSDGAISTSGYISSGINSQSTTVSADIRIKNAAHKGIIVRSASSQIANLQEWQDSSGNVISWMDSSGELYSKGNQVQTINPLMLIGA
jgi:hypothetical protein